MAMETAGRLKEIAAKLGIPFIYKSSYDKANRSSSKSFRGLGMQTGLKILSEVKAQIGVPVITDVHDTPEIEEVAAVVEVSTGVRCAAPSRRLAAAATSA